MLQQFFQHRQRIRRFGTHRIQSRHCFAFWDCRTVNVEHGTLLAVMPFLHFNFCLVQLFFAQAFQQKRHGWRANVPHGVRRQRVSFRRQIVIIEVPQPFAQSPVLITRLVGILMATREATNHTNRQGQQSDCNYCSEVHSLHLRHVESAAALTRTAPAAGARDPRGRAQSSPRPSARRAVGRTDRGVPCPSASCCATLHPPCLARASRWRRA